MRNTSVRLSGFLLAMALFVACSGSGSTPSADDGSGSGSGIVTTQTTAASDDEPPTTLPPGAVAGLEDFDGDGQPDPTCGTQDFGAGLVLRIPCTVTTPNEPEQGTTLVNRSLYRLPGSIDIDLTGISGSLVLARDGAGARVVIVVFNSDNLFQTGSATIGSTDTVDGTIRVINSLYPRSSVQVRGHTDATGSASANQTLSERRAATVKDYLSSHGLNATEITSVGLGSTQPLTEERRPDGSDSPAGRRFNRRVEIVVRPR
ncbi:MAG: OmpA-OmpF porin, family [Gaiellaceae bacterium]|nr:OmpA-OmpF porin, family [Gaiellaceae bacterium]